MSFLDTLIEMGFPKEKAERALGSTGGTNLEDAINWIINHPDDDAAIGVSDGKNVVPATGADGEESSSVEITMDEQPATPATKPKEPQEAKSIKCEDCGKLFRTEDEVHFHAVKSGHANFSESTDEVQPLTEEEKRARMLALQERLKQKRVEKEDEDKKAAVELEKKRRLEGQQIIAAKQRIEEQEMKKIAEEKKRQKKEDALVKQRILDQIKMDREAKKLQQGGAAAATVPKPAAAVATPPPLLAGDKKSYDQSTLQVRLMNGKILKQSFGAKEPLSAVRLFVQLQSGETMDSFTLMTNFPKRVYNDEDMDTPLAELGLVPSAVLMMTRKQ